LSETDDHAPILGFRGQGINFTNKNTTDKITDKKQQNGTHSPWTVCPQYILISNMKKHIDKDKKAFGETLRYLRKKRGLSQESLAMVSELDRSYIGGIERGERNISLLNIIRIANALGISPKKFFK